MSDSSDKIMATIEEMVRNATFTADALAGVTAMKEALSTALSNVDNLEKTLTERNAHILRQYEEMTGLRENIVEAEKLIAEYKATHDASKSAIFDAEKHQAVAAAYKDCFHTVFKPHTVRESVVANRQLPTTYSSGGVTTSGSMACPENETRITDHE